MDVKRRIKNRNVQLLVGVLSALVIGVGFFLFRIWPLPHYPGAILVEDSRVWNFSKEKTHWIFSINTCYIVSEDPHQVWEWYEKTGWFPFGENVVFPGWKLGSVCFEVGNQFHFDYETNYETNDPFKIYQQTLYSFGLCPYGVTPLKFN